MGRPDLRRQLREIEIQAVVRTEIDAAIFAFAEFHVYLGLRAAMEKLFATKLR